MGLIKFTNCRILQGEKLVNEDFWICTSTGKIVDAREAFNHSSSPQIDVIDAGGRIISPGLIDCQLNGGFGFNFSTMPDDMNAYDKLLREFNRQLISTGVTSYLPTITSQQPLLYQKVIPFHKPTGLRIANAGAESLGAHCEGPFLNPTKNGAHDISVLAKAFSFADLEECYGKENITVKSNTDCLPIKMITVAPELGDMMSLIPELSRRQIICSIGHSEATYEEAREAMARGASMVTHLFNAMRPLHHRDPGIIGLLGNNALPHEHFFGLVADGIHLHPMVVNLAITSQPDKCILVTDAMHLLGLPDGVYPWANGDSICNIIKSGATLLLADSDKIAGSSTTLLDCVNNVLKWSGFDIPQVLKTVTSTPATMLGLQGVKGSLDIGADADFVIFSETEADKAKYLEVNEVWKFGVRLYSSDDKGP
ncbi:N-acetylglucosamine-6-phosphate deacetylase [Trichoderma velutinum]